MTFGPKNEPRVCPHCQRAVPLPTLVTCPTCHANLRAPGDVGKALVEAMTDVLSDPLGKKKTSLS